MKVRVKLLVHLVMSKRVHCNAFDVRLMVKFRLHLIIHLELHVKVHLKIYLKIHKRCT